MCRSREEDISGVRRGSDSCRFAWAAGIGILLATLVFIPPSWAPTENFDPIKRLVWCLLAPIILSLGGREFSSFRWRENWAFLLLPVVLCAWMILRTVLRTEPWAEAGVLAVWILPVMMFVAGMFAGKAMKSLWVWLGVAAGIQAGIMVLQWIGADPVFARTTRDIEEPAWRMIGTIGYQNQAAAFLAIAGGTFALLSRRRWQAWCAFAVVFSVVCMTGSRGAVLGMFLAGSAAFFLTGCPLDASAPHM